MRISLVKLELKEQNEYLRRIAEALERLAPPIRPAPPGRKADLTDLCYVDPRQVAVVQEIQKEFARQTNTVPGSEAFNKSIEAFEKELREIRGQEAVDELPWNRLGKR